MIPLHKVSRLSGGYVECSPRRGSPRSGLEDCQGEVDVLPEPIVERCAHCEQEVASKGEGRTRGAALSPWRHGREEGETECTIRVEQNGEGATMARAESRGGTTFRTIHNLLRAWQCV